MSIRRLAATLAATLALIAGAAGCGTVTVSGHRFNGLYAADCAFHVWRAHHDVKNGHRLIALFHVWRAVHNCPRAVR